MERWKVGFLAIAAAFLIAVDCAAEPFPALFFVSGVAADDALNVRTDPDASAAIVTTIPSDRRDLEVLRLSQDRKWARIGLGEVSGWVASRFLSAEEPRDSAGLPVPMRCYGTEPFWGLWLPTPEFAEFESRPDPERAFDIGFRGPAIGGSTTDIAAALAAEDATGTLILRREICSDGMSDREFGFSVRLVLDLDGEHRFHAGCCSLTGH